MLAGYYSMKSHHPRGNVIHVFGLAQVQISSGAELLFQASLLQLTGQTALSPPHKDAAGNILLFNGEPQPAYLHHWGSHKHGVCLSGILWQGLQDAVPMRLEDHSDSTCREASCMTDLKAAICRFPSRFKLTYR